MDRALDRLSPLGAAALSAAAVTVCAVAGSAATGPALEAWYPALAKPWFTPPDWATVTR